MGFRGEILGNILPFTRPQKRVPKDFTVFKEITGIFNRIRSFVFFQSFFLI